MASFRLVKIGEHFALYYCYQFMMIKPGMLEGEDSTRALLSRSRSAFGFTERHYKKSAVFLRYIAQL